MSVLTIKQQKAAAAQQAAGCFGIPELKNPRYLACFKDGRRARLRAALAVGLVAAQAIPLYSHHQTRQSLFNRGWHSITELDLLRARARAQGQPSDITPTHTGGHHGR